MINTNQNFFNNKIYKVVKGINIIDEKDFHVRNFSKQWKTYKDIQIDSINNSELTFNFLKKLFFNDLKLLKDKDILEIGCGAGRFTEYFSKYCNSCTSIDLSQSVFYNISKKENNVNIYKADFLSLKPLKKFDIVFCRGVLQHTKNPDKSILKLFEFLKKDGYVYFDFYAMPKLGLFHPKYLIWRPFFQKFINYETCEKFLKNNIKIILKIKRSLDKFFFKKYFFSDCIIPVWDVHNIISESDLKKININTLNEMSILDTLDGLYAKYDKPLSHIKIINFLRKNNFKIDNSNEKLNCFKVSF